MSKGQILVIDDMPANLEVLSEILTEAGYTVATAIDGERALKRVTSHPPDLILLDVQMPGIDGFETCQRLKFDPITGSIPVIFITALSDTESIVNGFALGAVDYITKPFQEQELLARVNTHLQLRSLNQDLEQHVAKRTAELESALAQLGQSQLHLVQSEKMSTLGNLVAGIAHEINNPISFLQGNIQPALNYINDLFGLLDLYQEKYPDPDAAIQTEIQTIDLDFIRKDLLQLIGSMQTGVNRIKDISIGLRTFSRADSDIPVPFDLHDGLESTILILKHRLGANKQRPEIKIIKDYGKLSPVQCFAGQINQVFMNILANAIDALDEGNQGKSFAEIEANPNQITIRTMADETHAKITISDNGPGMSDKVKDRIFDHLFTTKGVGKGTGLGLAIAQQIIMEKHGGAIAVESRLGQGTTFILQLPIDPSEPFSLNAKPL